MQPEGLSGPLCWAVTIYMYSSLLEHSARIEELATVMIKAWQAISAQMSIGAERNWVPVPRGPSSSLGEQAAAEAAADDY